MKKYVLYHKNCADGFAASVVAWMKLRGTAWYVPMNYGEPVPEDIPDWAEVYLLDFSFPREVMEGLLRRMSKVVVLDHHKTAEAELNGLEHPLLEMRFDMSKSGAVLAWEYFYPDTLVPLFVRYVQDRDLWRWELPNSREFSAGLQVVEKDPWLWDQLISCGRQIRRLINNGKVLLRAQKQLVERQCEGVLLGTFSPGRKVFLDVYKEDEEQWVKNGFWKAPVVNATAHVSEVGEELLRRFPSAPFVGIYFDRADGKRQWSLRSRPGFDCSELAAVFGGGGHARAAGFEEEVFKTQ